MDLVFAIAFSVAATLVAGIPAFFNLKSQKGYPNIWGFIFVAALGGGSFFAFSEFQQGIEESRTRTEEALAASQRFDATLRAIYDQSQIIDVGDLGILVRAECYASKEECDSTAGSIEVHSTQPMINISGSIQRTNSERTGYSRGAATWSYIYSGTPFFFSLSQKMYSIQDFDRMSLELSFSGVAEIIRVRTAVLFMKGRKFRGEVSYSENPQLTQPKVHFVLHEDWSYTSENDQ